MRFVVSVSHLTLPSHCGDANTLVSQLGGEHTRLRVISPQLLTVAFASRPSAQTFAATIQPLCQSVFVAVESEAEAVPDVGQFSREVRFGIQVNGLATADEYEIVYAKCRQVSILNTKGCQYDPQQLRGVYFFQSPAAAETASKHLPGLSLGQKILRTNQIRLFKEDLPAVKFPYMATTWTRDSFDAFVRPFGGDVRRFQGVGKSCKGVATFPSRERAAECYLQYVDRHLGHLTDAIRASMLVTSRDILDLVQHIMAANLTRMAEMYTVRADSLNPDAFLGTPSQTWKAQIPILAGSEIAEKNLLAENNLLKLFSVKPVHGDGCLLKVAATEPPDKGDKIAAFASFLTKLECPHLYSVCALYTDDSSVSAESTISGYITNQPQSSTLYDEFIGKKKVEATQQHRARIVRAFKGVCYGLKSLLLEGIVYAPLTTRSIFVEENEVKLAERGVLDVFFPRLQDQDLLVNTFCRTLDFLVISFAAVVYEVLLGQSAYTLPIHSPSSIQRVLNGDLPQIPASWSPLLKDFLVRSFDRSLDNKLSFEQIYALFHPEFLDAKDADFIFQRDDSDGESDVAGMSHISAWLFPGTRFAFSR